MIAKISILLLLLCGLTCCSSDADTKANSSQAPSAANKTRLHGSFVGKFSRFTRGEMYTDNVVTEWCDTVWRNDRVHQQLVLWTEKGTVNSLSLHATAMSNGDASIGSDNIRLRYIDMVAGDAHALICGEQTARSTVYIGDALSEKPVTRLASNDLLKVWITVDIPETTPAGVYTGTIEVRQSGEAILNFDVKLLVVDRVLPAVKDWNYHLDIWQFPFQLPTVCGWSGTKVEMFSPSYFTLMEPFYELLADAGQRAVTTYIKDGAFNRGQTMIDWTMKTDGSWQFDYTNFDKFVEFMFELGIDRQINCLSMAGWYNHVGYTDASDETYKYKDLPIDSEEFATIWSAFLNDFRIHLVQKGWMDKAVLYMDETGPENMARIIGVIRANGSDWKIGLAGGETDETVEQALYDYSILIGCDHRTTANTHATFYTSCSQRHPNNYVTAETASAEMTWMAWHAAAKGLDGYLRWAFDYWTLSDPLNVQDGANSAGDFNMIYRTDNSIDSRPVSSIRFELMREGIQDYEKIRILGVDRFRNTLSNFTDCMAPDAERNVIQAQSSLKKASLN